MYIIGVRVWDVVGVVPLSCCYSWMGSSMIWFIMKNLIATNQNCVRPDMTLAVVVWNFLVAAMNLKCCDECNFTVQVWTILDCSWHIFGNLPCDHTCNHVQVSHTSVLSIFLKKGLFFHVYLFPLNCCSASDDSEHFGYYLWIVTRLIIAAFYRIKKFFCLTFTKSFLFVVIILHEHLHSILSPGHAYQHDSFFFPIGNQNSWACLLLVYGLTELYRSCDHMDTPSEVWIVLLSWLRWNFPCFVDC